MYAKRLRDNGGYLGVPASVTADPYWSNCVFALSGQGTNGSTPSTDTTGKSLTWVGSAAISTSQSKYYGSSVGVGSGNYVTTPDSASYAIGTNDFWIEAWVYASTWGSICGQFEGGVAANVSFRLQVAPALALQSYSSTTLMSATGTTSLSTNTWYHLASGRSGSLLCVFVNGVLEGSNASAGSSINNSTRTLNIGCDDNNSNTITGYINDLKFYNGVCLHTSSFTPPTRDMLGSARRYPSGIWGL